MSDKKWYAVRVTNGREQQVANDIKAVMPEIDYLIPTEAVVKIRSGKPVTMTKKTYPGYVILNFICDNPSTAKNVEDIAGVYGFVGTKDKAGLPLAIPAAQAEAMIKANQEKGDDFELRTHFVEGDKVRITTGPFVNFDGTVQEVKANKIKVLISVFGQTTSLYLDHLEIEKKNL